MIAQQKDKTPGTLEVILEALDAFRKATPEQRAEAMAFLRAQAAKQKAGKS